MPELKPIIEALLLASEEPLSVPDLIKALASDTEAESGLSKADLMAIVNELVESYEAADHGIQLVEVNGGYQFRTKAEYAPWVMRLQMPKPTRLSKPAVESLAIVAYRQPVTRADVDHIRGVDSGGVMKGLLERHLLKIVGRKDEPGRPLLYGTTPEFLELFGLKDLKELPPLKELEAQAQEMIRRSRETEEGGEEGLQGLEVDLSDLEWLDEKEKETFEELDSTLKELQGQNKKTEELMNPSQEEGESETPLEDPTTPEVDAAKPE